MNILRTIRLLATVPFTLLTVSLGTAGADEVYSSSFPRGIVTGTVNAELIVDSECIIAPGAFIKGDIKQTDSGAAWNITVMPGARINGNIEELGQGSVRMAIAPGQFFDGNIKEAGRGSVVVHVLAGLYDGNVEESGAGHVLIHVRAGGLFNGNSHEKDAGNMSTSGTGMYNGSTKEEGPGTCTNTILDFNGSPCE